MKHNFLKKKYLSLARHFWELTDALEAMPEHSLLQVCNKADKFAEIQAEYNALPYVQRWVVANTRRSEL